MTKINIYHGDSLKAMESMEDKKYGLSIVDPPYGIKADRSFVRKTPAVDPRNGRKIITKPRKTGNWDNYRPNKLYFNKLQRVSKNQIIFGGNYFADLLPPSSCWVVWDKVNGKSDQADCELAWTSFKSAVRQLRFMWCIAQGKGAVNGHIAEGNNKLWEKKYHPTQKPIVLYKWLLKNYGFNKDGSKRTIFDSHGGSMSIVIACIDLGFDIDIWEIDKDYYTDAVTRVKRHLAQQDLTREPVEINYIKD